MMTLKKLLGGIGVDDRKLRGYKWLVKRTIRKRLHRHADPYNNDSSNLVVFRLDDVGFGSINAPMAIMDVFLVKNHHLSLGLVMDQIDRERLLVEKITYGNKHGLFELVLHGWKHVDYSKLDEREQQDSLCKASEKMENLFGQSSKIFIPPYNCFNDSTLRAMDKVGVRIISSMLNYEVEKDIFRIPTSGNIIADPNRTYHIPETASFEKWDRNGHPIRIPVNQILDDIDVSIGQYGYAIVTIHPVTFAKLKDAKPTGIIDEHEINDLRTIIDCIESKNILFTSFSKLISTQN